MYNTATLVPAYGRDYTSRASLLKDWQQGKDFMMHSPQGGAGYTSIKDLSAIRQLGVTHLHFRYNKQTQVYVVKL